jgi:hypothetical protein
VDINEGFLDPARGVFWLEQRVFVLQVKVRTHRPNDLTPDLVRSALIPGMGLISERNEHIGVFEPFLLMIGKALPFLGKRKLLKKEGVIF